VLVETVVCSVEDAFAAEQCGAHRLEVCSSIDQGGITPSVGLAREIFSRVRIPQVAMIRPRPGDFCYSEAELAVMLGDIAALEEANTVVLGALTPDNKINVASCRMLLAGGKRTNYVFHRAFDVTSDLSESLEILIDLGFSRVLTSGGKANAMEGADAICRLIEQARGRIEILAGGGIRAHNVKEIISRTGTSQIHLGPFKLASGGYLKLDEDALRATIRNT